jgi:hypothetical protein
VTDIVQSQDLLWYAESVLEVISPEPVAFTAHTDESGETDFAVNGTSFRLGVGMHEGQRRILIFEQSLDLEISAWFPLDKPIEFAERLAHLVANQRIAGRIETIRAGDLDLDTGEEDDVDVEEDDDE